MRTSVRRISVAMALLISGCDNNTNEAADAVHSANRNSAAQETIASAGDWERIVSPTLEGGFVMGNPDAPVKLVEYASLTCPHCADFSREASDEIRNELVRSGRISFEVRNFVMNPIDMAASLLTRCQGAERFFPLTEEAFEQQDRWLEPFNNIPDEAAERLLALPPEQQLPALAQEGALYSFFEARGLTKSMAEACLSDPTLAERLAGMSDQASQRGVEGTPTFFINGEIVEGATTWAQLEPRIREALR